eukprot:TRINITY_DN69113_c0_g1_i1.p1 TRINITY_DN69113_c0_g1~~TRINITY_DN69113_c0_g1_i1.p1  ORF type:complete len:319 (-),score=45.14 TRINITY_DN69113_c0_g1_i1:121-1077(-)
MISRFAEYLRHPRRSRQNRARVSPGGAEIGELSRQGWEEEEVAADFPSSSSTEQRREKEGEFFHQYGSSGSDVWYMIDACWFADWKTFVVHGGPPPGTIDNGRFWNPEIGQPRAGVVPIHDYRPVNADVWTFFVQRYGGGPPVQCAAVLTSSSSPHSARSRRPGKFPSLLPRSPISFGSRSWLPSSPSSSSSSRSGLMARSAQLLRQKPAFDLRHVFDEGMTEEDLHRLAQDLVGCGFNRKPSKGAALAADLRTRYVPRDGHEEEAECYVCLGAHLPGDDLKVLPCLHEFHTYCIEQWLGSGRDNSRSCPVCRVDILQ